MTCNNHHVYNKTARYKLREIWKLTRYKLRETKEVMFLVHQTFTESNLPIGPSFLLGG